MAQVGSNLQLLPTKKKDMTPEEMAAAAKAAMAAMAKPGKK